MVIIRKMLFVIALLCLSFQDLPAANVIVSAEVDGNQAYVGSPITGTISVTHDQSLKVNIDSFKMEGKHLTANFVKDVIFSPGNPLIISIYQFQIPGKPPGLYLLPAVTVQIGNEQYSSLEASYSVSASSSGPYQASPTQTPPPVAPANDAQQSPTTVANPLLKLEAGIDGKSSLYPGQRTNVYYKYYFRGDIDLVTEKLPLLDAAGLIKIGEKVFTDSRSGNTSISEISQVVEAVNPGTFSFGPSLAEGYVYTTDDLGNHIRSSDKLSAEAPPVTVTVKPFPENGKPASFNGAVGKDFKLKVSLLSPSSMRVGDEIVLGIDISGEGNLNSVPIPDICCQPGFKGFFKTSDLPPSISVQGNTKTAKVRIYPLISDINAIPPLEFSWFDPTQETYQSVQSKSIPITVAAAPVAPAPPTPSLPQKSTNPAQQQKSPEESFKGRVFAPEPIDIEGIIPLGTADLYNKIFGTWWALSLIPIGIALLIYQRDIRAYLRRQQSIKHTLTGREAVMAALKQPQGSSAYFDGVEHGLKMSLNEAGLLVSSDVDNEHLPEEGVAGEVRGFLIDIEQKRFASHKKINYQEFRKRVETLLNKVESSAKKDVEVGK